MDILTRTGLQVSDPSEEDAFPVGRIRVWPASENIRKYIKHPLGNIAFRALMTDSVEWPFDQFTKRRLKDGTVLDHEPVLPDQPLQTDFESSDVNRGDE